MRTDARKLSRDLKLCLGILVLIFLLLIPTFRKNIRAEQLDAVLNVATNDKIADTSTQDISKVLQGNLATTVIFIDPKNEDLNQKFYDYVDQSKGDTKLNRKIYIYEEVYPNKLVQDLKIDMKDRIAVVFFEGDKKTKVIYFDSSSNFNKDFADKLNKLSVQ
ncbi:hypothetical protein OZX60_03480 [Streptococcaceae bacterium ESL0687]|nr:hypothetical protein OZX60_03480 [Streptococcaceae bacterium ESL0687]